MNKSLQRRLGQIVLSTLVLLPTLLAASSPLQVGRAPLWVLGTLAGVLSLSLLVVQVLLPTKWLNMFVGQQNLGWHRILGISVTGLVIAHIVGLYLYSPDDIGDALILAAPTYSRLGVLSFWCLLLSMILAFARHKLQLVYSDWQILHSVLAVAIVGTAVAHAMLLQGTLDGFAEGLLCGSVMVAVSAAIVRWYMAFSHR
ncbi:ferric reductase-like transmembrane domain-containing protein [Nodosilinea sp. LEGE 07088]|uniref:ferric reductase-like transmembrane domain-containing protein n=1 Tax=Nodosilinea sp. LEGE 07088 TaxID=2777968 RepID=UPI001881396F|nr:ferric reductase-like transmembrane domain-containing protein [Nodosilinea sp. LEGE 07088]MBE9138248.1 ferric reductase-like transmembrane domain-containing protein [Nodosilinea sp. LEGE 07088]